MFKTSSQQDSLLESLNPTSLNSHEDDDTIFTFQGKPIPPEDLKIIRRLLKNDDE